MQSYFLLQCALLYVAPCRMQCFACFGFCLLLFACFVFVCSVVFLVWFPFLFCMTTANRTVHWSFISTTFAAYQQWGNYSKMQLSFRLDKRPGESHMALDGKKSTMGQLNA